MIARYVLPVVAIGLLIFAVYYVLRARWEPVPEPIVLAEPARSPFAQTVAGAGMVEPRTENISIGSPDAGLVAEVLVEVGQTVESQQPLFRLDDRELRAQLRVRR